MTVFHAPPAARIFFFFFNFLLFFSSQVYSASFFLNSLPTQSGVVVALTAQENFICTVGPKRRIKLFFFLSTN